MAQEPAGTTDTRARRDDARPMVVVESSRFEARADMVRSLEAEGFEVMTCAGPAMMHTGTCPLVETSDCALVADASAVVHDLDLENDDDREVLLTLRARYPDLPVVVEASTRTAQRFASDLEGCTVVPPYSSERLAAAVREVVAT
jgi:DNA-binding NarL/FixJ family response regulator